MFLLHLACTIAFYHRSLTKGVIAGTGVLLPIFGIVNCWVRLLGSTVLIPLVIVGLVVYTTLNLVHIRASGLTTNTYFHQLKRVDRAKYQFASKWARIVFWTLMAVGTATIVFLLYLGTIYKH